MQKGTVLNFSRFSGVINYIKRNWCHLTLTAMFLIGIVVGIIALNNRIFLKTATDFTDNYISLRQNKGFLNVFISVLGLELFFVFLIFSSGSSVIGVSVVPLAIGFRGLIFGAIAGLLYSTYSFKGIAFNVLILTPPTIITVIFLIIIAGDGLDFCFSFIKILLPESKPKNLNFQFKRYCKRTLIFILQIVLAALLNSWLSTRFINIFNLK